MKIVFLSSANEGLRWFSRYYRAMFPEGSKRASAGMRRALALLREQPRVGHPALEPDQYKLTIVGTPFSLTYRLNADRIEILRVSDGRANPAHRNDEGPSLE